MKDTKNGSGGKLKKIKSSIKIFSIFIGVILIIGLLSMGYIYSRNFLNSRKSDVISVNGITIVENQSPENEIILNHENGSEDIKLEQEEILTKEKKKIEKEIESFRGAIASKNPRKIAAHFIESEQEKYKEFFTKNKDDLDVFEEIFSDMDLVYLGDDDVSSGDDLYKIAEYKATWNGYEFSIVYIKEDNKWLIMEF